MFAIKIKVREKYLQYILFTDTQKSNKCALFYTN